MAQTHGWIVARFRYSEWIDRCPVVGRGIGGWVAGELNDE